MEYQQLQEEQPQREYSTHSYMSDVASNGYQQKTIQEQFPGPPPHSDARFVAVLCYALGWFTGLLFLLFTRQSRYVRFHALQSFVFFGGVSLIDVGIVFVVSHRLLNIIPFFSNGILFLGFLLLNTIAFIGWLVAIVQAYRGVYYRLPLVGNMAAQALGLDTMLKQPIG